MYGVVIRAWPNDISTLTIWSAQKPLLLHLVVLLLQLQVKSSENDKLAETLEAKEADSQKLQERSELDNGCLLLSFYAYLTQCGVFDVCVHDSLTLTRPL